MNKDIKQFLDGFLIIVGTGVLIGFIAFIGVVTFFSLMKVATYFGVW